MSVTVCHCLLLSVTVRPRSALSDAAKEPFVEKASADRTRYEEEMAEAGLPLHAPKEPKARTSSAAKERPARKRKKAEYVEEEEVWELAPPIDWYVSSPRDLPAISPRSPRRRCGSWRLPSTGTCRRAFLSGREAPHLPAISPRSPRDLPGRYVPEGFSVQEEAPTAEQLAFSPDAEVWHSNRQ